jgi:hypothetical protein
VTLQKSASKIVRILPPMCGRLIRARCLSLDSAKTYGNLVHRTARRNTDEFTGPVTAALIGRLTMRRQNV